MHEKITISSVAQGYLYKGESGMSGNRGTGNIGESLKRGILGNL